jgi:urease accessory protein
MLMSGIQGRLQLRFANDVQLGHTVLHVEDQQPPLRVIRAFALADGSALVHLHNISGGVLGGDDLTIAVHIEPGAMAQITTTGATRIYKRRADGRLACQRTTLSVGNGGLLEYLPDMIIPFANSIYHQATNITLAADAGLFAWEVVAPGRAAHAESFAYERLQLWLDITAENHPIVLERTTLEPLQQPLDAPARMGPYRYLASLYCCHTGVPASCWLSLETQLAAIAQHRSCIGERVWGVSTLVAHGLLVRCLSVSGRGLEDDLVAFWSAAKHALYGTNALMPRKVR